LLNAPLDDTLLLWVAPGSACSSADFINRASTVLQQLKQVFDRRLWIAAEFFLMAGDAERKRALIQLSAQLQIPVCAAGGVQMHHASRRQLRDVLTAIRVGKPVTELGFLLPA